MYNIKKVKNGTLETDPKVENVVPCIDYTVTTYPEGSQYGKGIVIELARGEGEQITRIAIPDDCDEVYIMNDRGDTVDSYPRREEKSHNKKLEKEMRILT